jgi:hypothetical protein
VKFWDTSALVPLFIREQRSSEVRRVIAADPNVAVSFITIIEVRATAARRLTIGHAVAAVRDPDEFITELERVWTVADEYRAIVDEARHMIELHALRAADAVQLASAIVLCRNRPKLPFVTLDEDLAAAARLEGFPTLP